MVRRDSAAADAEEILELVEIAGPAMPSCASCGFFRAPSSDRAKIEKVGGVWRGDCLLEPKPVNKTPEEFCSHHTTLVAARIAAASEAQAAALVAALAKFLPAAKD